jgi:7-carboxy-7-deazaguanine synthase
MSSESLRITEIFLSIQGEATSVGYPSVFVRLTGCPLRCHYCDSEYAFYGGEKQTLAAILQAVTDYGVSHVCVTGGEPLAQPACLPLLASLCDRGLNVSLETSGAMPVVGVDPRVSIVMDLKTPGSGEVGRNDYSNIARLAQKDSIKFVICDRQDYEWALFKCHEYQLSTRVGDIFFSPSYEQMPAEQLAQWILADRMPIRLQTQLHKTLWGDKPGV